METQRKELPGHESTIQQLLQALNAELLAQTTFGKLASDLGEVRLNSTHSVLAPHSYPVFSFVAWN